MRRMVYLHFQNTLVPQQIRADGTAPSEESRTLSLRYSAFSLDALMVVCHYAALDGEELLETGNLAAARRYLTPFVVDVSTWKKPQLTPFAGSDHFFPLLAEDKASYGKLPPAADIRRLFWERTVADGTREIRKR